MSNSIAMRDLYYGNDPAPSLKDVIEKVRQNIALLDGGLVEIGFRSESEPVTLDMGQLIVIIVVT